MFEQVLQAPPDAILGLTEAFNADPNPDKINLGVGVYKDGDGKTPVFNSVRKAEDRILKEVTTKSYLGIDGTPVYSAAVQKLLFGPDHEVVTSGRAVTAQTPGGTGALRVAGDLIHRAFPEAGIWIPEPTWANHPQIFGAAGIVVNAYPYFDKETNGLALEAMLDALVNIPDGDIVLLHGCCQNPTGVDPTQEQWSEIASVIEAKELVPLVDFAYQGLGDGLSEDAHGLRKLAMPGCEMLVASSFSKNFGLYNDRVGSLTVLSATKEIATAVLSQVKICIRANYSTPPAHGSQIVTTVLNDPKLRAEWDNEVKAMRERINGMRTLLVDALERKGVKGDYSFIARQKGMFSFSGLTKEQVEVLRETYSIYIVGSGRINVAGITEKNIERLCEGIAGVV